MCFNIIFGNTTLNLFNNYGPTSILQDTIPNSQEFFLIDVDPSSSFSFSVNFAGDVNKDGLSDVLVGAHGELTTYIIFGTKTVSNLLMVNKSITNEFYFPITTSNTLSSFGMAVAPIGDYNGDGYDDLLIRDSLSNNAYII